MNESMINFLESNLGTGITLLIVVTICVTLVLRFGLKFDVNEYLASRKKKHRALAQTYCNHFNMGFEGDDMFVEGLFVSPSGTLDWICERCGAVRHHPYSQADLEKMGNYYLNHPKEYKKALRKYQKHAKKSL